MKIIYDYQFVIARNPSQSSPFSILLLTLEKILTNGFVCSLKSIYSLILTLSILVIFWAYSLLPLLAKYFSNLLLNYSFIQFMALFYPI